MSLFISIINLSLVDSLSDETISIYVTGDLISVPFRVSLVDDSGILFIKFIHPIRFDNLFLFG